MSVGAFTPLGSAHDLSGVGSSLMVTMSVDVPIGTLVHVSWGNSRIISAPSTVTDSSGNTWTVGSLVHLTGNRMNTAWSFLTIDLPVNGTITASFTGTDGEKFMLVSAAPGVVSYNQRGSHIGTGTQGMANTSVLGQYDTLAIGVTYEANGASDSGHIEDYNFTALASIVGSDAFYTAQEAPPNPSVIVYGPSFGISTNWGLIIDIFNGETVPIAARRSSALIDVTAPRITPPNPLRWGYISDIKDTFNVLIAAQSLGVEYFRYFLSLQGDPADFLPWTQAIRAAGLKQILTLSNTAPSEGNGPPVDFAGYQALLANWLDFLTPEGPVTINNEPDAAPNFAPQISDGVPASDDQIADRTLTQQIATATTASYLKMLQAMADVAHSTGAYAGQGRAYKVAGGTFSVTGVMRAYWYYLWTMPNGAGHNKADQFVIDTSGPGGGALIGSDLPNTQNPNRAIFAANQTAYLHMLTAYAMIQGLGQVSADFVDAHCFWSQPTIQPMQEAFGWIKHAAGLPMVSLASGQYDINPLTTVAVAQLGIALGMELFVFFSSPNANRATVIADDNGVLNDQGLALQALIASYVSPSGGATSTALAVDSSRVNAQSTLWSGASASRAG